MDHERDRFSTHKGSRSSSEGPTTADLVSQMNQLNQTISTMILNGLNQVLTPGAAAGTPAQPAPGEKEHERGHKHKHQHEHDCDCDCDCDRGCRDCERDDCYCRCCIGDADLVVYARLFELRVIPITLVNERRREKNIHLELSGFKTRSGETLSVVGVLVPPVDFVLPPCGEEQILIAVETFPTGDQTGDQPGTTGISRFQTAAAARDLPDVDGCRVLYADLRVEGCDIRPVRIALAIVPRDCDEYEIDCGCSCC